jgi:hypothetical protein
MSWPFTHVTCSSTLSPTRISSPIVLSHSRPHHVRLPQIAQRPCHSLHRQSHCRSDLYQRLHCTLLSPVIELDCPSILSLFNALTSNYCILIENCILSECHLSLTPKIVTRTKSRLSAIYLLSVWLSLYLWAHVPSASSCLVWVIVVTYGMKQLQNQNQTPSDLRCCLGFL